MTFFNGLLRHRPEVSVLAFFLLTFSFYFSGVAQVFVPLEQRSPLNDPERTIFRVKGDFTMIGNSNMEQNPLLQQNSWENISNSHNMKFVDVDNVNATKNSSSCQLKFSKASGPDGNCANVVYAGLYWSGRGEREYVTMNWNKRFDAQPVTATLPPASGFKIEVNVVSVTSDAFYHYYYYEYKVTSLRNPSITISFTQIVSVSHDFVSYYTQLYPGGWVWQASRELSSDLPPVILRDGDNVISIKKVYVDKYRLGNTSGVYADITYSGNDQMKNKRVKLKHENAPGYTTFTATASDIFYPWDIAAVPYGIYVGYCDVTDYVKKYGTGNYTVADIMCRERSDYDEFGNFGGWTMIVVYDDRSIDATNAKWRDIVITDGYAFVQQTYPGEVNVPITGFKAVQNGAVNVDFGIFVSEGDRGIPDGFAVQKRDGTYVRQTNPVNNSTTDFFNSTAHVDGTRNPANENLRGIDIHRLSLNNAAKDYVTNGQTSINVKIISNQDAFVFPLLAVGIDAWKPDVTVVQAPVSLLKKGSSTPEPLVDGDFGVVEPGDILEFSITVQNSQESVTGAMVKVPMPSLGEYVSHDAVVNGVADNASAQYKAGLDANGTLVWNLGDLPGNAQTVQSTLTYRIRVTGNCALWANNCTQRIVIKPTFSGTGVQSGVTIEDEDIAVGRIATGGCQTPIIGSYAHGIEVTLLNNECAGTDPVQVFPYCNYAGSTIPVNDVRGHFPPGYRFFNKADYAAPDAVEYTSGNGFPNTAGLQTYYAIPSNPADCQLTFRLDVKVLTSTPAVQDRSCCHHFESQPLTAIPTDADYRLFYYTSATGGDAVGSIVPSTETVGTREYWVAEGISAGCISPNRAKITVTVNPNPTLSVAVAQNACKEDRGGEFELTPAEGTAPFSLTWGETADPTTPFYPHVKFAGSTEGKTYYFRATDANRCFAEATGIMLMPDTPLTLTSSVQHACEPGGTGTVTLVAEGGYGTYVYYANDMSENNTVGVFSPTAGPHTFHVQDKEGCAETKTVTVREPQVGLNITFDVKNDCNAQIGSGDGSITATVVGGEVPYTYVWKKSGSETILGTEAILSNTDGSEDGVEYILTVTDAYGCVKTKTVTVKSPSQNPVLSVNEEASKLFVCQASELDLSASVTLSVSGGKAPYRYRLSGGDLQTSNVFNNLGRGNKVFEMEDDLGCVATKEVGISSPGNTITLSAAAFQNDCSGAGNGRVTLQALAGYGEPYEYSRDNSTWTIDNKFIGLSSGDHTFYVRDNKGCTAQYTHTLSAPSAPLTLAATDVYGNCDPSTYDSRVTLTATGGEEPLQYSYSTDGTTFVPTGNPTTGLPGTTEGKNYHFRITDALNCQAEVTAVIYSPSGLLTIVPSTVQHQCEADAKGSVVLNVGGGAGSYFVAKSTDDGNSFTDRVPVTGNTVTFSGLEGSPDGRNYVFQVKDIANCSINVAQVIYKSDTPLSMTMTSNTPVCDPVTKATMTLEAVDGWTTGEYEYTLKSETPVQFFRATDAGRTHMFNDVQANPEGVFYTATVKDSIGCEVSDTHTIKRTDVELTLSGRVINACETTLGTIEILTGGGVGNHTLKLTSGATTIETRTVSPGKARFENLEGATGEGKKYTLTVTDEIGCSKTQDFYIKKSDTPLALTIDPSGKKTDNHPAVTVNSGEEKIRVSGGTGDYTVSLSLENKPIGLPADYDQTVTLTPSSGTAEHVFTSLYGVIGEGAEHLIEVTDALGCQVSGTTRVLTSSEALVWQIIKQDNICSVGDIGYVKVQATGGTKFPDNTYRYTLLPNNIVNDSGVFRDLAAGMYQIKVEDFLHAEYTDTIIIESATTAVTAGIDTNGILHDCILEPDLGTGKITVVGTGDAPLRYALRKQDNTAPAVFSDNPVFDSLDGGTYEIGVKDSHGCLAEITHTVKTPTRRLAVGIDHDAMKHDCNAATGEGTGRLVAMSEGGFGIVSYAWNTTPGQVGDTAKNLDGSPAGISYTVTATDSNGCIATATGLIQASESTLTLHGEVIRTQCSHTQPGELLLTVTGGTEPRTLQWNDSTLSGLNPKNVDLSDKLIPFEYIATVTDALGCVVSDTMKVYSNIIAPLRMRAPQYSDVCDDTLSITVEAMFGARYFYGASEYQYHWTDRPVDQWLTNGRRTDIKQDSSYTVVVRDSLGCMDTATFTVPRLNNNVPFSMTYETVPACHDRRGTLTVTPTPNSGVPPYVMNVYDMDGNPVVDEEGNVQSQIITTGSAKFYLDGGEYILDAQDAYTLLCNTEEEWEESLQFFAIEKSAEPLTVSVEKGNDCENNYSGRLKLTINNGTPFDADERYTVVWDSAGTSMQATPFHPISTKWNTPTYTYTIGKLQGKHFYPNNSADRGGIRYEATVTDAFGCSVKVHDTIFDVMQPLQLSQETRHDCFGNKPVKTGKITVTSMGGTPSFYKFNLYEINGSDTTFLMRRKSNVFDSLSGAPDGKEYAVAVTDDLNCPVWIGTKIYRSAQLLKLYGSESVPMQHVCEPGTASGSITLETEGGTAAFSYRKKNPDTEWQTGVLFSGLPKGTHLFEVKDNYGCIASYSAKITEPEEKISVVFEINHSTLKLCSNADTNGALGVKGTGGSPYLEGYLYKLTRSDGTVVQDYGTQPLHKMLFTDLGVGDYNVYAKDQNGCESDPLSLTIEGPTSGEKLTMTITKNNYQLCSPAAYEGRITVNASNGSPGYQYRIEYLQASTLLGGSSAGLDSWQSSGVFENLGTGVYISHVKDAYDCVVSDTVRIEGPATGSLLRLKATEAQLKACSATETSNTLIEFVAEGGTPHMESEEALYKYSLDNNTNYGQWEKKHRYENLSMGSHTVYAKDDRGCEASYVFEVVQNPTMTAAVNAAWSQLKICQSDDMTAAVKIDMDGGTPDEFGKYEYSLDGGSYQSSNVFYQLGMTPDPHTVVVKDAIGCTSEVSFSVALHEGYSITSGSFEVCNMSFMKNDVLLTVDAAIQDKYGARIYFEIPKKMHLHYIRANLVGMDTVYASFHADILADTTIAALILPPDIPAGSTIEIGGQPYEAGDYIIKWTVEGICNKEGEIPLKVEALPGISE